MKIVTTWAAPVAVSLLLHAVLIALIARLSSRNEIAESRAINAITIELLGLTSSSEKKSGSKKFNPAEITLQTENAIKPVQQASSGSLATAPTTLSVAQPLSNIDTRIIASDSERLSKQPLNIINQPPSFLHKIEPVYPRSEQRTGSQANVLAEITIDSKGTMVEARIVKSGGINFDDAVMDALKKSIFSPAYIGKEPVAVRVFVPFRFELN